jgi:hypothetical protein
MIEAMAPLLVKSAKHQFFTMLKMNINNIWQSILMATVDCAALASIASF